MELDGFFELVANCKDRVEAGHWVLEDDGAALASEVAELSFVPFGDVFALVEDVATGDFSCISKDLHDRVGCDGLAGA